MARAELDLVGARRSLELARLDLVQTLQLDPVAETTCSTPRRFRTR